MKKILFSIASLFAAALTFTACSSSNDDGGSTVIDNSNIVKTDAQAVSLVNGSYGPLQTLSSSFSWTTELIGHRIIATDPTDEPTEQINRFIWKDSHWMFIKTFNKLYASIENDNNAIRIIKGNPNVSQATQDATIGKAKLLRGLSYLYLVQLWGEVPIRTENDSTNLKRNSIDEVYTQIIADLEDAERLLPETSTTPVDPTKDAADALLSRAYLAWGNNPLTQEQVAAIAESKTDPAVSYNNSRLEKAVEYADKVINRGHHALLADFTHVSGRTYEAENVERILTIQHGGDAVDAQGNHQTHCGWTQPFAAWDNDENGLPDPTKPKADPTQNHSTVADITPYLDWKRDYPGDSVRRKWSYKTHIYNPETGKYYDYLPPLYPPIPGKAVDESWENAVNLEITLNDVDRIEVRYAEVLLNKAEALVELGRNQEAATPFNLIQQRAYGNSDHNLTTVTLDDIKVQWDHEFAYEQKIGLNFYRWKDLIAQTNTVKDYEHYDLSYATAGAIGRDGNVVNPFFAKIHSILRSHVDNVRGKHYRVPIPTGVRGEDLGITPQNPGY